MFSHMTVGSNDLEKSRAFYDALFGAVGARPGFEAAVGGHNRLVYLHKGTSFLVTQPIDGNEACYGNGATIGFAMDSIEQANAWHEAGLASGGTAIEDPPGWREGPAGKLYLAYLRDPDGNKLCALHRG